MEMSKDGSIGNSFENLFGGSLEMHKMFLDFLVLVILVYHFSFRLSDQLNNYFLMRLSFSFLTTKSIGKTLTCTYVLPVNILIFGFALLLFISKSLKY